MSDKTKAEPVKRSPILEFFEFRHLPVHLQDVSRPVGELAELMDESLSASAEKAAGLRKLLEAKDCFDRAKLKQSSNVIRYIPG